MNDFHTGQIVIWKRPQWCGSHGEYIPAMVMGATPGKGRKRLHLRVLYLAGPVRLAIDVAGGVRVEAGAVFIKDKPQVGVANIVSLREWFETHHRGNHGGISVALCE